MSGIGLVYIFIRLRIAYMELLKRAVRLLDPQRKFKAEVIEYCTCRNSFGVTYGDTVLVKFVKHTKKACISEVTKDDIYLFRDELARTTSEYHMYVAMVAIRSLLRHFKGKGVICVDPVCIRDDETNLPVCDSLSDMKGSTIPKPDRNRDLVKMRLQDPEKHTWEMIGDVFKVNRVTAYQLFQRHALKYVDPQIYKEYRDKMRNKHV